MPLPLDAKVDLRVAEGLLKILTGMHVPTAKKIGRKVFYRFVAQERGTLRTMVPVREGRLRRAVKARTTRAGGAQVYVDKSLAPHFHMPESGTKDRATKKGWRRGKVTAKPYLAPWRKNAQARYHNEVVQPLLQELMAAVNKGMHA